MTKRDPLGELEKALFEAARHERPSNELRARIRDAARGPGAASVIHRGARGGARIRRSFFGALGLAAVVALAFVIAVRSREAPGIDISPEGDSAHRFPLAKEPHAPTSAPAPSALPEPELARSTRATPQRPARATAEVRSATAAPTTRPSASLSEEVAILDRARTSLNAGDTEQALGILDEYDQVLHGTALNAEATLLRVEGLARSGQTAQASQLARRFVASNPGSPLAERARRFVGTESSSEDESLEMGGRGGSQ